MVSSSSLLGTSVSKVFYSPVLEVPNLSSFLCRDLSSLAGAGHWWRRWRRGTGGGRGWPVATRGEEKTSLVVGIVVFVDPLLVWVFQPPIIASRRREGIKEKKSSQWDVFRTRLTSELFLADRRRAPRIKRLAYFGGRVILCSGCGSGRSGRKIKI